MMLHDKLVVLDHVERQVRERPDAVFLRFRDGQYSYSEFHASYCELASSYQELGIRAKSVIPTLLPNCGAAVESWFALMHLGAIWAPINTEFRGEQLSRALSLIESDLVIVHHEYLEFVLEAVRDRPGIRRVIVYESDQLPTHPEVELLRWEDLPAGETPRPERVERTDVAMIIFTSGSTGESKAVQLSHGYLEGQGGVAQEVFDIREDDVLYCPFPLYHWDATVGTVVAALRAGCTAALGRRFSVSNWWEEIAFFGATVFDFMGATLTFLNRQKKRSDDAENTVRLAWGVPMPDCKSEFERRFDLKLVEGYGSTEGGISVLQYALKEYPEGACGEVAPGWKLRIVGESGEDLPAGEIGEIVTRPDDPTQMMSGYYKNPEADKEHIRGGWFFSGDLGRVDEFGNLYFEGRKKDVIRRRGENISALEIERILQDLDGVSEVAAFGVPSEFSEEEVAVALVLRAGVNLTDHEVIAYCDGKMAKYMIPQHVFFLPVLPKTPTEKVAKAALKEQFSASVS